MLAQEAAHSSHSDSTTSTSVSSSSPETSLDAVSQRSSSDHDEPLSASAGQSKFARFNWTGALGETALFLGIEHTTNLNNYVDIPHDHFFHRYAESVRGYHFDRWNDGNHLFTNYIGHPFSGAIVGFVYVQNSPSARHPASAGAYWKSRLKATAWITAYSVQWEIGPLSESSLGNYGIYPYRDSKGNIVNSTGLVDWVLTPLGGLGWMAAEDWLDGHVLAGRRKTLFCIGINPARTSANLLRLKKPCYRDTN